MHDAIDVPAGGHEGGIEELFFGARARHWHLHNLMDAAGGVHTASTLPETKASIEGT